MSVPQCNDCRFWRMDETTIDQNDPDWGFGFCRRRPPVLIDALIAAEIIPPRYGNQTDLDRPSPVNAYSASIWPATCSTEWCGEYSEAT